MSVDYFWIDEFLRYDEIEDFQSIGQTQIRAEAVWMPTLYLMNAASEKITYRPRELELAFLYNDGTVEGWLSTYFIVGCSLDIRRYEL